MKLTLFPPTYCMRTSDKEEYNGIQSGDGSIMLVRVPTGMGTNVNTVNKEDNVLVLL